MYTCYQPRSMASARDLEMKAKAYDNYQITTHLPAQNIRVYDEDFAKRESRLPCHHCPCMLCLILSCSMTAPLQDIACRGLLVECSEMLVVCYAATVLYQDSDICGWSQCSGVLFDTGGQSCDGVIPSCSHLLITSAVVLLDVCEGGIIGAMLCSARICSALFCLRAGPL